MLGHLLRNASIQTKILLGFGLVIAVVSGFSLLILLEVLDFVDSKEELDAVNARISKAKDLQLNVANVWQFYTDASLTRSDEVVREEAKPSFRHALADLDELRRLSAEDSAAQARLKALTSRLEALDATGERMFHAYLADWDQGNRVMDAYDRASEELISALRSYSDELAARQLALIEEMNQLSGKTIRLLVANLVLSILGGFSVGLLIARGITRPIHRVIRVASLLSKGRVEEAKVVLDGPAAR
ncbi:MAG: hypothetical protein QM765_47580 [Myxococcales bacterium]